MTAREGDDHFECASVELVDDDAPAFFAPVSSDLIDGLLGQYRFARQHIDQLAGLMAGDLGNVVHYFIEGNAGDDRLHRSVYVDRLFQHDGALKALNAAYWSKALSLTDVYDCMPQARRDEWNASIREHKTPDFAEDTVRSTLAGLLAARQRFFAERVDGIFRNLSHEHVTNCPEGFGRRMILAYMVDQWGTSNSGRCGYINDLRAVIARFMGRDEPKWNSTSAVVTMARKRPGEWITLDGGTLRMRVYKKGTAHLEVHPDMAYRLNQILAHLHPIAIPSEFRTKPKKRTKEFEMVGRPLPFAVLGHLAGMRVYRERVGTGYPERYQEVRNARAFDHGDAGSAARKEAERVLEAIGGVPVGRTRSHFQFDYDPDTVLDEIVASGCIPDRVAHQFYPTPEAIATVCQELAEIGDADTVLEPSAGQGDLAAYLPKDRTTCVEISALHCAILKARGYRTHQADFIAWADDAARQGLRFDRVVMNPPFSDGRAQAHIEAAAQLLKPSGRLVAVLPASMRGKAALDGFEHEWSRVYSDEFSGTTVSVAVLLASRATL
jgi:predicted RNA methylase